MKAKEELKLLLLQIRNMPSICKQEFDIFVKYLQLGPEQVNILNAFEKPDLNPQVIEGYDALLIGGASEASVLEPQRYPFVSAAQRLLLYCLEKEIPVFASCFGFQLCILALGGEIVSDSCESDFPMGSVPIRLTPQAKKDPLMHDTPATFHAVAVHKDKAIHLPENCQLLAETDRCAYAFRVIDKPFWAFQFHPEVDKAILIDRLTALKKIYTKDDSHLDQVLANAVDTPESNLLCSKFVERVLLTATDYTAGTCSANKL